MANLPPDYEVSVTAQSSAHSARQLGGAARRAPGPIPGTATEPGPSPSPAKRGETGGELQRCAVTPATRPQPPTHGARDLSFPLPQPRAQPRPPLPGVQPAAQHHHGGGGPAGRRRARRALGFLGHQPSPAPRPAPGWRGSAEGRRPSPFHPVTIFEFITRKPFDYTQLQPNYCAAFCPRSST